MSRPLHLTNIRLWTGHANPVWATSVTLAGGRIQSLDGRAADHAHVIDGGGAMVVPGLIDAHVHLLLGARSLETLDLSGVLSRDEFEAAIDRRHRSLEPGRWLIASGWSQENWSGDETPDKSWLAAAGDRPVVCNRVDLHAAVVNDAVLERCDLTAARPPQWGGRIGRDPATGEATGLMVEAAAWELINPLIPEPTSDEKRRQLLVAQEHLHGRGVTAAGTMEYRRDVEAAYLPLRERLTLRCRITLLDRRWPMDVDFGRGFPSDEGLAVIGYKAFLDGTLGSRTARLLDDYADDPGNRGLFLELAADGHLDEWLRAVVAAGLSPSMHAIGDAASRLALDAIDAAGPAGRRLTRVEHAQQIAPEDVARFDGITVSMQPQHKADDGRFAERRLGRARLGGCFAFRSLLDAGARLAFGSDWPVVACDPIAGIRAAVTGRTVDGRVFGPAQRLTVEESLRAYTSGAAAALRLDRAGVIGPGRDADLTMLDRDPFRADWDRKPPRVVMTIAGGRVVFDQRR